MKVAIICIGDELMNGNTINSNSSWIAKKISNYCDLEIEDILTLNDDIYKIKVKISDLLKKNYKYIFVTGGLGSTHDDITKNAFKEVFNSKLILDEKYYNSLLNFFDKNKSSKFSKHLKNQAEILDCSTPIPNKSGIALGMFIQKKNINIFIMPGVPSEMKSMMNNEIIPNYIDNKFKQKLNKIIFLTTGITESKLSILLSPLIDENKDMYKFSFLPSYSGVKFSVLEKKCITSNKNFNIICKKIKNLLGEYCYGFDNDKMESIVGELLVENKLSIAFAESCTGGLISKKITDVPGSSIYYKGSIIAYSNKIKQEQLKIPNYLIEKFGAVSRQVGQLMAENIKNIFKSDIGLSVTGISGPGGNSIDKPVGLVFISISYKNKKIIKKFNLINDRKIHREITSNIALNMLRLIIK